MVEAYTFPAVRHMAGGTIRAQPAEMRIIFLMAGCAHMRGVGIFHTVLMAARTFGARMLPIQPVVGEGVVKCRRVQTDNVSGTSLMFGMAYLTFFSSNFGKLPVKSGTCLNVSVNFVMTVEAKT